MFKCVIWAEIEKRKMYYLTLYTNYNTAGEAGSLDVRSVSDEVSDIKYAVKEHPPVPCNSNVFISIIFKVVKNHFKWTNLLYSYI